jgi:hypothetical protein
MSGQPASSRFSQSLQKSYTQVDVAGSTMASAR